MNKFLVIDIGNTSVKYGVVSRNKLKKSTEIPTNRFFQRGGGGIFKSLKSTVLSGTMICGVVPRVLPRVRGELGLLGIRNIHVVTHKTNLGIGICYPKPETIGPDRLVNAVAAAELYGSPAVVVDFGTAVTFDVISAKGEYLGGVIAPGLNSMTNYLYEKTALLPRISLREPLSPIGKNTVEAMRSGAVIGYRGLVREILHSIVRNRGWSLRGLKRDGPLVKVIATGGHSTLISKGIREIQFVNQGLTLEGLRILYLRNA